MGEERETTPGGFLVVRMVGSGGGCDEPTNRRVEMGGGMGLMGRRGRMGRGRTWGRGGFCGRGAAGVWAGKTRVARAFSFVGKEGR